MNYEKQKKTGLSPDIAWKKESKNDQIK